MSASSSPSAQSACLNRFRFSELTPVLSSQRFVIASTSRPESPLV